MKYFLFQLIIHHFGTMKVKTKGWNCQNTCNGSFNVSYVTLLGPKTVSRMFQVLGMWRKKESTSTSGYSLVIHVDSFWKAFLSGVEAMCFIVTLFKLMHDINSHAIIRPVWFKERCIPNVKGMGLSRIKGSVLELSIRFTLTIILLQSYLATFPRLFPFRRPFDHFSACIVLMLPSWQIPSKTQFQTARSSANYCDFKQSLCYLIRSCVDVK